MLVSFCNRICAGRYADAQELVKLPARIRICKGAYNEPPEVAFPDKKDVDDNYVRVMQLLLSSGIYHGIATHDPKMIDATIDFATREGIGKDKFEFQMLYGIRRDLQKQLARDGYNMRIYVPYGKHWYPYFMRRLAERPANMWFVMKNLFKGYRYSNGSEATLSTMDSQLTECVASLPFCNGVDLTALAKTPTHGASKFRREIT